VEVAEQRERWRAGRAGAPVRAPSPRQKEDGGGTGDDEE
jgi:hypothetical protein